MAKNHKVSKFSETKRVGKFGIIGVINTALDFLIYNVMFSVFNLAPVPANIVAATFAMTFSFFANKRYVFQERYGNIWRQAASFIIVTVLALYVIQNIVIYFLTEIWNGPLDLIYNTAKVVGLDKTFTQEFVFNNGAKVIATGFSMVWNYLLYKKIVVRR
jgi:putative flippase GtrA